MLNQFILPDGLMAMDAEGLLKVLGKPALPILDILIRESIQNSLDAAKNNIDDVSVDFSWLKFTSFDALIDKLKIVLGRDSKTIERLSLRIRDGLPAVLCIKDGGTVGLSGPIRKSDSEWDIIGKKNFRDLVYQIGRNHETQGAGGSYGFGKTIYYRTSSCGLVMFYTRCLTDKNSFEERLIFCLVSEDEQYSNSNTGIMWWGGELYNYKGSEYIAPVTNSQLIHSILSDFGINPFENNQSGTVVGIISPTPSIFSDQTSFISLNQEFEVKAFYKELAAKIEASVLRWYWPRLLLRQSDSATLKCVCEGIVINTSQSVYRVFTDMLTGANMLNEISPDLDEAYIIKDNEIILFNNNEFNQSGVFLFPIHSRRPNALIGTLAVHSAEGLPQSSLIVNKIAMMRKPRMVVYYNDQDMPLAKSKDFISLFFS